MMGLLQAIISHKEWLEKFTREEYPAAFRAYMKQYAPAFAAVLQGLDESAMASVADGVLDGLADYWKKQRIWNRGAVRFDCKQMMIDYLSPMLLHLEEPNAKVFAQLLCDRWAQRWPGEAYGMTTYKEIRSGFHTIADFIPGAKRSKKEEDDL